MISRDLRAYFSRIGRNGGRKSRRSLSSAEARAMVAVRLARAAFREYRTQCFWPYRDLEITAGNAAWVAEQLRRNGDRGAWQRAARIQALLCR
jgi:hypothetical protein